MISSRNELRLPCRCSKCSQTKLGYRYQTRRNLRRHEEDDEKLELMKQRRQAARPPQIIDGRSDRHPSVVDSRRPMVERPLHPISDRNGSESPDAAFLSREGSLRVNCAELVSLSPPFSNSPAPLQQQLLSASPAQSPAPQVTYETFRRASSPPPPDPWINADPQADSDNPLQLAIPALKEETYIRMAYLQSVMANVYGKLTWEYATQMLTGSLMILKMARKLPDYPAPVRSLAGARRRLGIDPDAHIVQYAACPLCWKLYAPDEMSGLQSPSCLTHNCLGRIYQIKNGVRVANLIVPQVSLIGTLRRMFLRPGFAKLVERRPDDRPGRNTDEHFVMSDISHGEMWYFSSTVTSREVGSNGTIRDVPTDNHLGSPPKLYARRFGLQLTLNTDWFGLLSGRPHSSGPVYWSINNLPRHLRYLQVNVICPLITPGPKEPSTEQLNNCLAPTLREMKQLKHGVKMDIHGEDADVVYADCICANCDTPAARKFNGTAGHTHDFHPCCYCHDNVVDIDQLAGYEKDSCEKDDFNLLKHAFKSRNAGQARQDAILRDNGIRWATFNSLSDWLPSSKTVLDFMHNVFLGLICHLFMQIIFKAYMLSGLGGANSPKQRFENIVNAIRWPSHVTRLPKNLGENQSLKKADEWRRLICVAPIILWYAWQDETDNIAPGEPPIPANARYIPTHSRDRVRIYDSVLKLCAGTRILSSRTISVAQARQGQEFLRQYCQDLQRLGIHTTINHHLSRHYLKFIKLFGPVPGWWLFAFERFNGMLEKVNHNGHDAGRMELTLLRSWTMAQLIYEYLLALPDDDSHSEEKAYLDDIIFTEARKSRGGIMTELAVYRAEVTAGINLTLPRRIGKPVNITSVLPELDLYPLMLNYARDVWPDLHIVTDNSAAPGIPFCRSTTCHLLPYIRKDGIRYGSASNRRSQADSFAFIVTAHGARVPIKIHALFAISLAERPRHVCAVISALSRDEMIPLFPWDTYSTILGLYTTYADSYDALEIVPVSAFDGPLALIPIESRTLQRSLWVSVSLDNTATEPELDFDEEGIVNVFLCYGGVA